MRAVAVVPLVLLFCVFCPSIGVIGQPPAATPIYPASVGVKADGTTDDTATIQKALDAAGQQGGVVRLPAGKYLVAGSLKIPAGVALVGCNQAPVYIEPLIGTVILVIRQLSDIQHAIGRLHLGAVVSQKDLPRTN